ncbi:MAG: hypothetical protein F6K41_24060 [Symploca sp. SIO3E6]|nr:hypothetical protein [Caldora sp. SIO3E6]
MSELHKLDQEGVVLFAESFAGHGKGGMVKVSTVVGTLTAQVGQPLLTEGCKCSILIPGGQWKKGRIKATITFEED